MVIKSDEVTNREELHKLINRLQLKVGAEIGTQQGLYAKYLLENTDLEMLYLIDAWQYIEGYRDIANVQNPQHDKNLQETIKNVAPFPNRYNIIKKFSVEAAKEFEDLFLDFVYIDADHSYKGTMDDLEAWYSKVKVGGVFAGHDFLDGENICGSNFGVKRAVTEFFKDTNHDLFVTAGPWPTWFMEKKEG